MGVQPGRSARRVIGLLKVDTQGLSQPCRGRTLLTERASVAAMNWLAARGSCAASAVTSSSRYEPKGPLAVLPSSNRCTVSAASWLSRNPSMPRRAGPMAARTPSGDRSTAERRSSMAGSLGANPRPQSSFLPEGSGPQGSRGLGEQHRRRLKRAVGRDGRFAHTDRGMPAVQLVAEAAARSADGSIGAPSRINRIVSVRRASAPPMTLRVRVGPPPARDRVSGR